MNSLKNKSQSFYRTYIHPMRWQYLLFGLVFLVVFTNIIYGDFYITVRHSLTLISSIFKGEFFDFYQNCHMGAWGNVSGTSLYPFSNDAGYEIFLYIIFAIWNFPLWIVEQVTHANVQDMAGWSIYSKSMLVVFAACTAYQMDGILKHLNPSQDQRRTGFHLFITSGLLMMYTFVTGNYDIIEIYFMMAGIRALFDGNNKKFLLNFALANSLKFFSLFLFLPLVLFTQKKWKDRAYCFLMGLSGIIVHKFLFSGWFTSTPPVTSDRITSFFGLYDIQLMNLQNLLRGDFISVFLAVYIGVCFFSLYWKYKGGDRQSQLRALFFGFAIFGTLNVFCFPNPYWSVLVVPFLILLIMGQGCLWPDLLLETGYSVSLIFYYGLNFPWIPQGVSFYQLPLFKLIGDRMPVQLQGYDYGIGANALWKWLVQYINMDVVFKTFAVFCLGFLAIRLFPWNKKPYQEETETLQATSAHLWIRLVVLLGVMLIPVVNYIWVVLHYVG